LSDIYGKQLDGYPKSGTTFSINFGDLEVLNEEENGVCKGSYFGAEVAIKKIRLPRNNPNLIKHTKRELCLLNALKHPHVAQFIGWNQPDDSDFLLLIEEFPKGGNLSQFLGRNDILISWDTRIYICLDIARAVLYLHKSKVIYRYLTTENILLDDAINPRIAKISNFPLARSIAEAERMSRSEVSPGEGEWFPPEILIGMPHDERSDAFSFGVILLECILGSNRMRSPQLAKSTTDIFELDYDKVKLLAEKTACPKELLELALYCCKQESSARPDFDEIYTLLLNVVNETEVIKFEEFKISDVMAMELSENLSKTEPNSPRSGSGSAGSPDSIGRVRGSHSTPVNSSTHIKKPQDPPSIFANLDATDYLKVESMVDTNTHWNVRVKSTATVKEVCEKLAKKLDEKYKVVQLYIIQGKKKVLLGGEQTVGLVRSTFGGEKGAKFGVLYFEDANNLPKESFLSSHSKSSIKEASHSRRSSLFSSTKKKKSVLDLNKTEQ